MHMGPRKVNLSLESMVCIHPPPPDCRSSIRILLIIPLLFAGIPYRRGYLLYGPPGCGKSSFM